MLQAKKAGEKAVLQQSEFPLRWTVDSSRYDTFQFKGYTASYKTSEVTGRQRLYYGHLKPFEKPVPFYNYFIGENIITAPKAYIIPQGWHNVTDLLKLNNVQMERLTRDTLIEVEAYRIEDYKSAERPYEKHHKNNSVLVSSRKAVTDF